MIVSRYLSRHEHYILLPPCILQSPTGGTLSLPPSGTSWAGCGFCPFSNPQWIYLPRLVVSSISMCKLYASTACCVTLHRSSPWCKKSHLILSASFNVPSSCTKTENGQSLPKLSMLPRTLQTSIIFPLNYPSPSWKGCYTNWSVKDFTASATILTWFWVPLSLS